MTIQSGLIRQPDGQNSAYRPAQFFYMKWKFPQKDKLLVQQIIEQYNVPKVFAEIMVSRGFKESDKISPFFTPDILQLHNPFLMKGMEKAVDRVIKNIFEKKPIFVFGDYDVDGTTGVSLLYIGLTKLGGNVTTYIPNRQSEGYDLSQFGIDKASTIGADLLITCDCGINAINCVNYANEKGIDIVITDHHIPGNILPNAFAILNPKQSECEYPFKELSGVGVALKFLTAIVKKMKKSSDWLIGLMDLAALGTAADLVQLKDENRIIVHYGLKTLKTTQRPGLRELLKSAKIDLERDLSVTKIIFHVAPKINAAGRLGNANRAVELFTTTNSHKARELVIDLDKENKKRQIIQQNIFDEAIRMVKRKIDLENDKAIILGEKGWHYGVVGIVASKLKEKFNRPAIVISFDEEGKGIGSARSLKGLDLHEALSETSNYLENYGGHAMAAGLKIDRSNFTNFKKKFLEYVNSKLNQDDLEPPIFLDAKLGLIHINQRLIKFMKRLGPYGPGNMPPKFAIINANVVGNPKVISNGDHVRFQIKQDHSVIEVIGFGLAKNYEMLILGEPIDIACVIETNVWKGKETIQLNAIDIRLSESV
tara:strand:- start:16275 stop:18059 length:1785 start_codon:yes stop_codon:yes gene_type:complete